MRIAILLSSLILCATISSAQVPDWIEFFSNVTGQNDFVEGVAFDANGNTYMTGWVSVTGQSYNYETAKIDQSGSQVFLEDYNGTYNGADFAYGILVDEAGFVYVTGSSQTSISSYAALTVKYSPTGSIEWVHSYDALGQASAQGNAVAIDQNGTVYVTGWAEGGSTSGRDLLVLKIDSLGNELDVALLTQVTGGFDEGTNIAVGTDGNVYVAANSNAGSPNGVEALVVKYDPDLNIFWTAHINGTNNGFNEFPVDLIVDDTGNTHVLAWVQNMTTGSDFALVKLDSFGQVVWSEEFDAGGNAEDIPEDMVMDDQGNLFVTGRARPSGGYNDFATIKYNSNGEQQWNSYYDGPNNLDDDPIGIAVGENGNIYVCGESNRTGNYFEFIVVQYDAGGMFDWEFVHDADASSNARGVWMDPAGFLHAAGEGEGPGGDQDFMAVGFPSVNAVDDEDGEVARSFELEQNYPNPFNPATTFSFSIPARPAGGPQSSIVNLKVFDLLGQEVATIVNERLDAGSYSLQWDATGKPSGVYFYTLSVVPQARRDLVPHEGDGRARQTDGGQVEDFTQARKLVILK